MSQICELCATNMRRSEIAQFLPAPEISFSGSTSWWIISGYFLNKFWLVSSANFDHFQPLWSFSRQFSTVWAMAPLSGQFKPGSFCRKIAYWPQKWQKPKTAQNWRQVTWSLGGSQISNLGLQTNFTWRAMNVHYAKRWWWRIWFPNWRQKSLRYGSGDVFEARNLVKTFHSQTIRGERMVLPTFPIWSASSIFDVGFKFWCFCPCRADAVRRCVCAGEGARPPITAPTRGRPAALHTVTRAPSNSSNKFSLKTNKLFFLDFFLLKIVHIWTQGWSRME